MNKNSFANLLDGNSKIDPGSQQRWAAVSFTKVVESSGFSSDARSQRADRIVIGVASYSVRDLQMLDMVAKKVNDEITSPETEIVVFDTLSCKTMDEFQAIIPGIGVVLQTPVVGVWRNGILVEKASGSKAFEVIKNIFKLSS